MSCPRGLIVFGRIAALLIPLLPAAVLSQDSGNDPCKTPRPYSPPTFGGGAIGVLDAVATALDNDPNLLLRQEDVCFQKGIAEELSGDFDWVLNGELSYQHEERELRDSVKKQEQDRRDDLLRFNRESCQTAETERRKAEEIRVALEGGPADGIDFTVRDDFTRLIERIEEQIAAAQTPEERAALLAEWVRILESGLIEAENLAVSSQEACDESQVILDRLGETPEFEEFDTGRLDVHLDKLFRNGVFFAPFVNGEYDSTQFIGKRNGFFEPVLDENGEQEEEFGIPRERFVDFGGKNVEDLYTVRVGFDLNVPLLRDRGGDAVAAAESAAGTDADATELIVKHAASETAFVAAAAYWDLLAAQERVKVLERSVELQRRLAEITGKLIENEQVIGAQEWRVKASQANAEAQLDLAKRDVATAGLALLQAMGLDLEDPSQAPRAEGEFPAPPTADAVKRLIDDPRLVTGAVARRYDVRAARTFAESSRILAAAAELNLRSRLDVAGGLWTTATGESSLSNAVDRWVAPSWRVGLSFEKPFGNRTRRGLLAQSEARLRQDQISAFDLERNVRIGVSLALAALAEAVGRLERAEEAAKYYQQTIDAEIELFDEGGSNVVDSILTEQQQTGARLNRIDALREVAILFAQLRFETGTLVTETERGGPGVTLAGLTRLPEPGS